MSVWRTGVDAASLNARSTGHLPGLLGVVVEEIGQGLLRARLEVEPRHWAPNGFLHAATVVALADTGAGYACAAHLPEGASGFTTIELKTNHLGTAKEGTIVADVRAVHLGRSTHVWDATVSHRDDGRTIALFRCTQMILWPR
ncbi:MAG TPA: PaaI family thioesterase [Burkholderiaceae bacterium]|nr:PaaI family thioesterase [Burkholderiaceae bacterium]